MQIALDVLERARQIDLLSYLRTYEPSNLVKVKGTTNVYCTAEHDSLKLSNGKWYWCREASAAILPLIENFGGRDAFADRASGYFRGIGLAINLLFD